MKESENKDMSIKSGDKFVVISNFAGFFNEGDVVEVTEIKDNGYISFAYTDEINGAKVTRTGITNTKIFEEFFEKVEEKVTAPTITQEYIDSIMEHSDIEVSTVFDKCTIVSCRLPNGFVIIESSACVSPENYDEAMGFDICMKKIEDKVWELEGYRLQTEVYETNMLAECCCDDCPCNGDCENCDEDEYSECLNNVLDCNDCNDYDCPNNTKS